MRSPSKLLLVDDHQVLLRGLEWLIKGEASDMVVVGTANNAEDACTLSRQLSPDLVLLDLDLGGVSGLAALPRLIADGMPRVLVYTGVRDAGTHREAVMLGARGVLSKGSDPKLILKAIRCVLSGEVWLDRASTGEVLTTLMQGIRLRAAYVEDPRITKLTRREREIVAAMCAHLGRPAKRVATALNISEHTLRNHLSSIYEKLGVGTRIELCAFAEKNGLAVAAQQPGSSSPSRPQVRRPQRQVNNSCRTKTTRFVGQNVPLSYVQRDIVASRLLRHLLVTDDKQDRNHISADVREQERPPVGGLS